MDEVHGAKDSEDWAGGWAGFAVGASRVQIQCVGREEALGRACFEHTRISNMGGGGHLRVWSQAAKALGCGLAAPDFKSLL